MFREAMRTRGHDEDDMCGAGVVSGGCECLECVERESIDDLGHSRLCLPLFVARGVPAGSDLRVCPPLPRPLPTTSIPAHSQSSSSLAMPIAPITGKLRKRFWLDLSVSLGMGISAGYAFWFVFSRISS